MILEPGDTNSPVWARVKGYVNYRLSLLRTALEGDLPEVRTAKLRGSIEELKRLIREAEEEKPDAVQGGGAGY